MHIAFLTPEYPHANIANSGGLGTSIKNLASALIAAGVQVTVFVYAQKKTLVFEDNGIQFHLIEDRSYKAFKWLLYRKYIQNYCNSIIKKQNIDLIEAPDWTGITAFMKFKVPLIIRFHGSDTYFCHIEKRPQKRKNFWFEKLATRGAQAFIAPTAFAGSLSATLFNIQNKIIKTIHYGLELSLFENENPLTFDHGMILYIGTIIRKKGVFELPAILQKVTEQNPAAKLVLIGMDSGDISTNSPSTWKLVEQEFKKLELTNYTYLGQITYDCVRKFLPQANVCIFPSFAETLGMVTIESMALQKPVVNTNLGWAQELMVDGQSGYLVDPKNHTLFAQRILTILNDGDFAAQMGRKANEYVKEHFDIKKIAQQNIQFYNQFIKR
ncbi:glycosyltransferase family 4 protein [Flavobacterium sp. 7A]|uniref:glycosyltransferase family 4 protein n=1 Tax=Flavobacterium sp. 7A TaxID=2940571 RepID=UPI0022278023|nr:glycosyltransferase family 4 protein [Flavobacterium sp. 7A]MCW2119455.1 glycosyltransferase involved in cell wall biosynthesis [Flavobacterium sp. 7A]